MRTRSVCLGSRPGVTGAWRNENAAVAESDAVFERVTLTARTLAVLTRLSYELFQDLTPAGAEIIEQELIKSLAVELDRVALRGTGTAPEPRGVLNQTGVTIADERCRRHRVRLGAGREPARGGAGAGSIRPRSSPTPPTSPLEESARFLGRSPAGGRETARRAFLRCPFRPGRLGRDRPLRGHDARRARQRRTCHDHPRLNGTAARFAHACGRCYPLSTAFHCLTKWARGAHFC